MKTKHDGRSVFPELVEKKFYSMGDKTETHSKPGMSLRGYFAAVALQGMLAHSTRYKPRPEDQSMHWHDAIAKEVFEIADAMLKEHKK